MSFLILAYDFRSETLGAAVGAAAEPEDDYRLAGMPSRGIVAVHGPRREALASAGAGLLEQGRDPRDLLDRLMAEAGEMARHQVFVVDAQGGTAAYSGRQCAAIFGHTEGTDHVAGGTRMSSANVVGAMSLSFERSGADPLWERLLLAVESGERAGGDAAATRSARLLIYRPDQGEPLDLAVHDRDEPVRDLRQLVGRSLSRLGGRG